MFGFFQGSFLTENEIEDITGSTVFNEYEVESLYMRFKYLDRTGNGTITYADLQMIPEFDGNPFGTLILEYIESKNKQTKCNFACFLEFLSLFSEKTDRLRRIAFLFELFDIEKTGRLTRRSLREIIMMLRGVPGLPPVQTPTTRGSSEGDNALADASWIEKQIDGVLSLYDRRNKGYLSKGDFARLYNDDETLEKNLLIDFGSDVLGQQKLTFWDIVWPTNK